MIAAGAPCDKELTVGGITFESAASTVTICNPLNGFAVEEQSVEVRRDPILGDASVFNPFQKNKASFSGENDRGFIAQLVERSAATCIFCGERLAVKTARYPEELVPGGRLVRGEATLLPNLFALGAYHPVVVLSRAHFLELAGFTPALIADGLSAAGEFLRLAHGRDRAAVYTAVGANYLPPGGASLIHPHLQMLTTPAPYTGHERLLRACRAHHERHGTSCLDELVSEEERLGLRFVGRLGGWRWLAAFAPQGSNEVLAVHESEQDLAALTVGDRLALAAGISKVLAFYGDLGYLTFNYALFSVRRGAPAAGFRLFLRIVNRQNLSPGYRNDDYFLQKLLHTDVVVTPPEELALRLRAAF
jgi:UDPglucose--hexose-1-phosphate uridylyltransferase